MIVPVILFLLSSIAVYYGFFVSGWEDIQLVGGASALASLFLVIRAWQRPKPETRPGRDKARSKTGRIIVDGSNVMYWKDNTPDLSAVREVVKELKSRGLTPGVMFDANAGHLIFGKYVHDRGFARHLGMNVNEVMVVQKGTPADPLVLQAAIEMDGRVVSNDRFRDWHSQFPDITRPGFLIRGGYDNGRLWLDLDGTSDAP
ncbi:NYN domain-containing protein [Shimia biformata]|uniref:NYN domain-containing protein n=1 Tax=Shimia biformata TaxID=1294299 RepID=UPI00194F244D|nr:hypothetical protein [Shimia biformata]